MILNRGLWTIGLALVLAGCGGEKTSSSQASIAGDWMYCEDEACSLLDDQGWRLAEDGTGISLEGSGMPFTEQVCVALGDETTTYRFEGDTLTFGDLTVQATLEGNRLTLYEVPYMVSHGTGGTETVRMVRVQATIDPACSPDNTPLPPIGP